MNVLVCISHVPDTTSKISFTPDQKSLNAAGIQYIINPYDEIALSKALEIAEQTQGQVTVLHVGDASTEPTLRKALAIGAHDAVRIDANPQDAWFVAQQIAHFAKQKSYDLILTGKESIDFNGSQVPAFLGELLGIPSVSSARKLTIEQGEALVERDIEGGKEILQGKLPMVVGTGEGVAEARIPNMRGIMSARTKPLEVIEAQSVDAHTEVVQFTPPTPRGAVTLVPAGQEDALIALLHEKAKVI
jgi:electron transfer flavoprotein beta subunit